jgi:hypothetical protein
MRTFFALRSGMPSHGSERGAQVAGSREAARVDLGRFHGHSSKVKQGTNLLGRSLLPSSPATAAPSLALKSPPRSPASGQYQASAGRTRGVTHLGFPPSSPLSSPIATLVTLLLSKVVSRVTFSPIEPCLRLPLSDPLRFVTYPPSLGSGAPICGSMWEQQEASLKKVVLEDLEWCPRSKLVKIHLRGSLINHLLLDGLEAVQD